MTLLLYGHTFFIINHNILTYAEILSEKKFIIDLKYGKLNKVKPSKNQSKSILFTLVFSVKFYLLITSFAM